MYSRQASLHEANLTFAILHLDGIAGAAFFYEMGSQYLRDPFATSVYALAAFIGAVYLSALCREEGTAGSWGATFGTGVLVVCIYAFGPPGIMFAVPFVAFGGTYIAVHTVTSEVSGWVMGASLASGPVLLAALVATGNSLTAAAIALGALCLRFALQRLARRIGDR